MILDQADLEELVSMAKRGLNPDLTPKDYSHRNPVLDFCAEHLAQLYFPTVTNVHLALEGNQEARKRLPKILNQIGFISGVIGRISQLEGGNEPSVYSGFNTDEGNQIDIFLEKIGYIKN